MRHKTLPTLILCVLALPLAAQPSVDTPEQLASFQAGLEQLSTRVLNATVGLEVGRTVGSGVIVTEDGFIITAAHLFREPGQRVKVTLHDGKTIRAETLGRMVRDDFALMKITTKGKWPYVKMGRSGNLKIGTLCIGTGHPGGLDEKRTAPFRLGQVTGTRSRFLRTSCIIDRGDSGGPLFDLGGRVIAIHSRIGMSFRQNWHVPVDHYHKNWKRLVNKEVWGVAEFPDGPIIGIYGDGGPGGTRVRRVYPDLPAEKSGIEVGDLIIKAQGEAIDDMDELKKIIARHKPGDEIELHIKRDGVVLDKKLKLARSRNAPVGEETTTDMPVVEGGEEEAIATLFGEETRLTGPFEALAREARESIVEIESGGGRRLLGTIVDSGGWIITKAAALREDPICVLSDGTRLAAKKVKELPEHDLAILKVEAKDLKAVVLESKSSWKTGQLLVQVGTDVDELEVGVVSVLPRRIPGRSGYLGVSLEEIEGGARIAEVQPDTAAKRAGLKSDDVIIAIQGKQVKDRADLIEKISSSSPRTKITLKLRRGETELEVEAVLGTKPGRERWQSRGFSGRRRSFSRRRYSERADGFKLAVQHDALISPRDCGGPVYDAQGRCIAINIARANRTSTLAVPSSVILPLVKEVTDRGRAKK